MPIAPIAINNIRKLRKGPTGSFKKKYHPINAAKTVDVSRNIAASPTLSSRVASIIDPKLKIPTTPPITHRNREAQDSVDRASAAICKT